MKMTEKQKTFCLEYLKDFNATRAAIAAKYSKKTAAPIASRLLRNVNVQDFLVKKVKQKADEIEVSIERVLQHLYEMAFFDATTLVDADGDLKPIGEWPPAAGRLISGLDIQVTQDGKERTITTKKIKIPSRERNTENLGRYLSMFTDKIQDVSDPSKMIHVYVPGFVDDEEKVAHGVGDNGNGRNGGNGKPKNA